MAKNSSLERRGREEQRKEEERRTHGMRGSASVLVQGKSKREEEEEDAREGRPLLCSCARGKEKIEREKVRGGERVFNPNNSQPKRLNYP